VGADQTQVEAQAEAFATLRSCPAGRYAGNDLWRLETADLANRQMPTDVLNYSGCTFLERDDRIVDAATGDLAGTKSPCVVSQGSYGYHPEAHQQATADARNFLRLLFQLQ
jgi:hypothetical protein